MWPMMEISALQRFIVLQIQVIRRQERNQDFAKAAVTHNEINESIATVRKTRLFVSLKEKRACLFHWIGHTALKCYNELQSHCAKNGSDRFWCNDQSHCNEICEVFALIAKSLKLDYRYLISIICMLLFTSSTFLANNYSNWRRFRRMKSRIKPNWKQSYFNRKASSVNLLRFSKLTFLQQFFSPDAKTMQ